jgi:hypothetical protein
MTQKQLEDYEIKAGQMQINESIDNLFTQLKNIGIEA